MTHEEAIKKLKDILEEVTETDDSVCYVTSDDMDALKAAIEALEIQPLENCISKEEVINAIHKTIYEFFDIADDGSEEPMNDKDKLLLTINKALSNAVKALPSVTPSRPKGKWEVEHKSTDGYTLCVCSNCKDYYTMTHYEMKYCPNCGAKMGVEE